MMNDTISRQAVKEILDKNQLPYHKYPYVWDEINALPPAQLSTNLAEVGTDTISRQAAIDAIEAEKIKHGDYLTSSYVGYEMAEKE